MSTSERGEHNEIGFRKVDEEAEHDEAGDQGAEGGRSDAADKPPAAPAEDGSPVGDTDQHSEADA